MKSTASKSMFCAERCRLFPRTKMLGVALLALLLAGQPTRAVEDAPSASRVAAVRRLCERLGLGEGQVVADIGCGNGVDTLTFAEIVGKRGTVFAEEIGARELQDTLKKSHERQFSQVVPVLGHTEDPRLPDGLVDLAYMRLVFHHFARPRLMLQHLWFDLKPGGCLVVIDQRKGPLQDWVSAEEREKTHHWTGETTVVRLAREAGFLFEGVADDLWYEKDPFVLILRKPKDSAQPKGDPDVPLPLDAAACVNALALPQAEDAHVAFVGLDRGRSLLPALRQALKPSARLDDIVLEEWATAKDEAPENAGNVAAELLRTVNGDLPTLTNQVYHAVVFADAFHRLWNPAKLLERLRQAVRPGGFVAVLDRAGPSGEVRRVAGHRRRIAPEQVSADMRKAGFSLVQELNPPAADRFFVVYRADEK